MQNAKYGIWILYAGCLLVVFFVGGGLGNTAGWLLGLVLGAHVIEFFVKRHVMVKAGGSMGAHFVQTLIYGLFHWKPLEESQRTQS